MRLLLGLAGLTAFGVAYAEALETGSVNPASPSLEFEQYPLKLIAAESTPEVAAAKDTQQPSTPTPLDESRVRALLSEFPEFEAAPAVASPAFEPPRGSAAMPLPPKAATTGAEDATGPLSVVRYGPVGSVAVADAIRIHFDRPMIKLGEATAAHPAPAGVSLSPAVAGSWRWLGTDLLEFQPDDTRLPMATQFEVEVSAELAAVDGEAMAKPLSWEFSTPSLALVDALPKFEDALPDPVIVLQFNQRVDADQLLPLISVRAKGRQYPLRPVMAPNDQVMVLRAVEPWPGNTSFELRIAAGAPSAEGPLVSTSPIIHRFQTLGPLRASLRCDGSPSRYCAPDQELRLHFSSPLSPASQSRINELLDFGPNTVVARPIFTSSESQEFLLDKRGWDTSTLRVGLSPVIEDIYGQRLSGPKRLSQRVAALPALLFAPGRSPATISAQSPRYRFYSLNYDSVQVRVQRVDASHWAAFKALDGVLDRTDIDQQPPLPGLALGVETIKPKGARGEAIVNEIDLAPYLSDSGTGMLLLSIEPGKAWRGAAPSKRRTRELIWLQFTNMALDAKVIGPELQVWANRLRDGRPLADVRVAIPGSDQSALSDHQGVARLALADAVDDCLVLAEQADDAVLLAYGSLCTPDTGELLWHLMDDRGLYRPGELYSLKGWVRDIDFRDSGDLQFPIGSEVKYEITQTYGVVLAEGSAKLSEIGSFHLQVPIPISASLGEASVNLSLVAGHDQTAEQTTHRFQIEEFRTPQFEAVLNSTPGPHFPGDLIEVSVSANYYAGGPLGDAEVDWSSGAGLVRFVPPNRGDWEFGIDPWELKDEISDIDDADGWGELISRTDASGRMAMEVELASTWAPLPLWVSIATIVEDHNQQSWEGYVDLLAHPAAHYVGIKAPGYAAVGESLAVELLVVDVAGDAQSGQPIEVSAVPVAITDDGYNELGLPQRCAKRSDQQGLAHCAFTVRAGDYFQVSAITVDPEGRQNLSRWRVLVSDSVSSDDEDRLFLISDQEQYEPGDTASMLIRAPFAQGHGLLRIDSGGATPPIPFVIEDFVATVSLRVQPAWISYVTLDVTVVEQSADPDRLPRELSESERLKVDTATRQLRLRAKVPASAQAPGEASSLQLQLLDHRDEPVANAEIAVFVVDEAVLGLAEYDLRDPLNSFYTRRDRFSWFQSDSRSYLAELDPAYDPQRLLASAKLARLPTEGEMDSDDDTGLTSVMVTGTRIRPPNIIDTGVEHPSTNPPQLRANFTPLAAFLPELRTDAEGRVRVQVDLPDNITRYRVMAVASAGATHFGIAEAQITAQLPLMVRPSPPRFARVGDSFELPVTVQNHSDQPQTVAVAVNAQGLALTGTSGFQLEIPAQGRASVAFPASAVEPGAAALRVVAQSKDYSDASATELSISTAAAAVHEARYGVLDSGAVTTDFVLATDSWPQLGGLQLTTSASALPSLGDAYVYLQDYPYDCSEQVASRLIANASLGPLLEQIGSERLPAPADLSVQNRRDLNQLLSRQEWGGGFTLWPGRGSATPFVSLHVIHALWRAERNGFAVPKGATERIDRYLADFESTLVAYEPWAGLEMLAYAEYLHHYRGGRASDSLQALLARVRKAPELSAETIAWLLIASGGDQNYGDDRQWLRQQLHNRLHEGAASAHVISVDRAHTPLVYGSPGRADAVVLEALLADDPESTLIPKLVRGLEHRRRNGHWRNTLENAFALVAMQAYFERFEAAAPDFIAQIWLGEDHLAEHDHEQRLATPQSLNLPHGWLQSRAPSLTLAKQGPGRLYYRLGLSHTPRSAISAAADRGFKLVREYRGLNDPSDVRQREDGTWEIRAGATVEVIVQMRTPARRFHVALTDPLPAGLEVLNPELSEIARRSDDQERWFEHQNLRSERAEAFATELASGEHRYRYLARATTVGEFIVPPSRAEMMYEPEVYGHAASDRVIVVAD